MSKYLKKRFGQMLATTLAISSLATFGASALDGADAVGALPAAVLTSNLSSSVGTVLTSDEVMTAEQALEKARAEAEAKAKAEAEAKAKAEAEAKAKAEAEAKYNDLISAPIAAKTVAYSSSLLADGIIKENAQSMGQYKLTFYCPCATCNGRSDGKTALGTIMAEGRTIAVDSSIIPLGSRVYIDGFGVFIAEDTGGAIKGSRIDVCVSSHSGAYDLGVKYANVYVLS